MVLILTAQSTIWIAFQEPKVCDRSPDRTKDQIAIVCIHVIQTER